MQSLNTDFAERAVMRTQDMEWQASPSATVWRKRLDLLDGEYSRVTSVVRYDPQSSVHAHGHPPGEEILVLEGVFSDEHGDYSAGSYLLNPKGFRHAPFSKAGCVLFVKLCQYAGDDREKISIDTRSAPWMPPASLLPRQVKVSTYRKSAGFVAKYFCAVTHRRPTRLNTESAKRSMTLGSKTRCRCSCVHRSRWPVCSSLVAKFKMLTKRFRPCWAGSPRDSTPTI